MNAIPQFPAELERVKRSGIRAIMDQAWELGEPITHLEVGEPNFAVPPHIIEAFCRAATSGETRYTPNGGIKQLREACARKLAEVNGIHAEPDQVLVTVGAMQGLMCAVLGLTRHGDEILIPTPGWPNYDLLVAIAGARSVPYELRSSLGFQPDPERIESLITERTKMIILNTPSNPLGTILQPDVLDRILDIADARNIWVLSDECYDQIVFDDAMTSPATRPHGSDRTISVHSFSKTFAMTGLRLGYLSAPLRVTKLLTKLQESMVACVNTPTQFAGVAALEGPQECVHDMVNEYRARRDLAVGLARAFGLDPREPSGAFYVWLQLPGVTGSLEFTQRLLSEHRVAVAPGSTFGEPESSAIRISLAADRPKIEAGLAAINELLGHDRNRS